MLSTCVICNRLLPKKTDSVENDGKFEEVLAVANKFFMLLERYLDYKYFEGIGEMEERGRMQFLLQQVMRGLRFCGKCSKIAESFCELYNQFKSIELLINWKLEALSEVLTDALETPIKIADFDKKSKVSDTDGVRTTKIIRLIMDFKRDLIKNCDKKLKTSSPRLKLHRCQRKSKHDGSGSLGTNSVFLEVSPAQNNVHSVDSVSPDLKPLMTADEEGQPNQEDMDTYSPPSTQSDPSIDVDFEAFLEAYNETDTAPDIQPQVPLSGSHLRMETSVPETTNASSVEDVDPQAVTKTLANCRTRKTIAAKQKRIFEEDKHESFHIPPPVLTQPTIKPPPADSTINPATGKVKCNLCPKEFVASHVFRRHYKMVHLKIRHMCGICQKEFVELKNYREHYKSVHAGLTYKCPKCEKTFMHRVNYQKHLMATTCGVGEDEIAKCKICGKTLSTHSKLRYHIAALHPTPGSYKYAKPKPKRKKKVSDDRILPPLVSQTVKENPKSVIDPITGKHKCSLCLQEFRSNFYFVIHCKRLHLGITYKCTACKKVFDSLYGYRKHYPRIHAGSKTICQKCGKIFAQDASYQEHMKATLCGVGEDSIAKCNICGKVFTTHPTLRTHIRTVHQEPEVRRHLCDVCGNGYKLTGDLNRHRRKVHPEVAPRVEDNPEPGSS